MLVSSSTSVVVLLAELLPSCSVVGWLKYGKGMARRLASMFAELSLFPSDERYRFKNRGGSDLGGAAVLKDALYDDGAVLGGR